MTTTAKHHGDGWGWVIGFILLGLLVLFMMTRCAPVEYIDDTKYDTTTYPKGGMYEIKTELS